MPPVALFTGAWIETCFTAGVYMKIRVALFTCAWIETDEQLEH